MDWSNSLCLYPRLILLDLAHHWNGRCDYTYNPIFDLSVSNLTYQTSFRQPTNDRILSTLRTFINCMKTLTSLYLQLIINYVVSLKRFFVSLLTLRSVGFFYSDSFVNVSIRKIYRRNNIWSNYIGTSLNHYANCERLNYMNFS